MPQEGADPLSDRPPAAVRCGGELTTNAAALTCTAVLRRVFIAFAWLLAALWLPATLHCAAETSGWFDVVDCCGGDDAPASAASGHEELDHCATLGLGVPREDLGVAVLSVPVVALLQILPPSLAAETAAPNGVTPRLAAPPEIGGLWRATRRVVAAAQAP